MKKRFLTGLTIGLAMISTTGLASATPINYLTNSSFEGGSNGWSIVNRNEASSAITGKYAYDGQHLASNLNKRVPYPIEKLPVKKQPKK